MSQSDHKSDNLPRCSWCEGVAEFIPYHDQEWGFPVADDQRLFEKICLESFQSGLSWRTILNKRDNFRAAFAQFDFHRVAQFDQADIARLLGDPGIVRHRGKIEAVINNAKCAKDLVAETGSLAAFFWEFEVKNSEQYPPQSRTTTPESVALAKALKQRGWKFVGPTTAFAFMQAMGLINDHSLDCHSRAAVAQARAQFTPPRLANERE
ncbi:DNA-3-methyladenine glycosylase I [Motilimonas eburnea]|uniref:DNA-3-methyladenine glycosylase I n=1 Tax=Motilimonas eburnea TaxID=1737488 RepID=UPI001E536DAD|nr:DNA-3-methyladenine glycosylase I [Motilimonas eburnea]MCE2572920.1 DNA-3-methyladenine glycosylase I [Motilimonas eburnea]